ncbi:4a-hydroxytetrahydrobiopterin dehydratase [Candidatus Woesearchaeota archaeon]|nr:4a-hydroxytetrahydrobiopterin dehydratase [Candidatus Woesearchaeota archaeon]
MWKTTADSLVKDFEFSDFKHAIKFVNKVAHIAEKYGHHPDIVVHDYNHVRIILTTHEHGAITEKDHELSEKIDHLL